MLYNISDFEKGARNKTINSRGRARILDANSRETFRDREFSPMSGIKIFPSFIILGSQNGFDNSGRRGDVHWVSEEYPQDNANVARTIIIQVMVLVMVMVIEDNTNIARTIII